MARSAAAEPCRFISSLMAMNSHIPRPKPNASTKKRSQSMKTPLKLDDKRHQPATGLHCGPRPASQTALLHSGGFASNRTIKHFGDFISATSHNFYDTPRTAAQRRPFGWVECVVLAGQRLSRRLRHPTRTIDPIRPDASDRNRVTKRQNYFLFKHPNRNLRECRNSQIATITRHCHRTAITWDALQ